MNKIYSAENKPPFYFILTLAMLSMLTPFAIDTYLPAFLAIAQDLAVLQTQVQNTLAIFTVGMALGQLLWGPLTDRFGRKSIILLGTTLAAAASFGITQIENIYLFYLLRFVQGFFGAAPVVVSGALLRDLFSKNYFSKMMSLVIVVTMIAPLLAPIIGGYFVKHFHWHSIFYLLMGFGLLTTLLVAKIIPETLSREKRQPLALSRVLTNFAQVLRNKTVLGYMLCSGLSFAGMYCFLTAGSLVYIGIFGVSVTHFGYFFIFNIITIVIMTSINGRLVLKLGADKMLRIGLFSQLIAGIWLGICGYFSLGLYPTVFGVALFIGMISTVASNATAAILDRFPQMAGTANSVTGTLRFGIGAAAGGLLAQIPLHSARPMQFGILLCISLGAAIYLWLCRAPSQSA